jgi:exonuclease III
LSDVLLKHRGGNAKNNLLNILKKIEDVDITISCSSESPYIDPTEFVTYISKFKNQFCILSVNIQSIRAKFDALSVFIQSLANIDFYFSVICIQESWISSEFSCDVVYEIPGYKSFTLPSTCSTHSGLITYVLDIYNCSTLNCYKSSPTWECLPLVLSSGGLKRNVTVLNTYRPPRDRNADIKVFLDVFTEALENLSIRNKDVIVAGDFNIDLLKIDNRSLYASYLESMYSISLVPSITLPTRLSKNNATLIDHIFCSFSNSTTNYNAGIITSSISDHFMTFLCADIKTEYTKPPKFIVHQTKTPNAIASFTREIIETDFMSMLNQNVNIDPNENYEKVKNILTRAVDKHLPTKLVKFNKHRHSLKPWITQGIVRSIKMKDNLYRNLNSHDPNSETYVSMKANFKTFNTTLKRTIRAAKIMHYDNLLNKFRHDSKKTWGIINTLLNIHKNKKQVVSLFKIDGSTVTNTEAIANNFNMFFSTIGAKQSAKIPRVPNLSFANFLTNNVQTVFSFHEVTVTEVLSMIKKFKPKSSYGIDNLSMKLLKHISEHLSSSLTLIINQSLNTGIFPDSLKVARVIPLFKKGETSLFDNYRPISLLPVISKIFEKTVHNQLYTYFNTNKLLYKHQYGFRPDHSVENATLEFVDRVLKLLDSNFNPFSVFIDLSKAFDTLNHDILLHKLSYYGIKNTSLAWFESYLSNRYQYVDYGEKSSSLRSISIGVPQGSILGPLLFLIYINDINADDATLTSTLCCQGLGVIDIPTSTDPNALINSELNKIFQWLCVNELSLNINKTKYMVFHLPQKKLNVIPNLSINNIDLERVSEFNFLGTTITETLSWKSHVNTICKKLSKTIGILYRLRNTVPRRIPYLQKKAIRCIFNKNYIDHTTPVFKENKLLKFKEIYHRAMLKFHFKYVNGTLPSYFDRMFELNPPNHEHFTRQNFTRFPNSNKVYTSKCIRFFIPKLLQESPRCILDKCNTHCIDGFARYIKTYYLSNYNENCVDPNCYACKTI